ncbi:hypothetical protein V6N13_105830 [Hibiscus sabdariffa]
MIQQKGPAQYLKTNKKTLAQNKIENTIITTKERRRKNKQLGKASCRRGDLCKSRFVVFAILSKHGSLKARNKQV